MNTRGTWQKELAVHFQDAGLRHIPVDFGYVILGALRPGKTNHVADEIVQAYQNHRINGITTQHVVAHSFGTLSTARALEVHPDMCLKRIIFFGSILPRDFPWSAIVNTGQVQTVLNETCPRDPWPKRAGFWIPRAGTSGCCSFNPNTNVVERSYGFTEHSGLATALHCDETWIPFLLSGKTPAERITARCSRRWRRCPAGRA